MFLTIGFLIVSFLRQETVFLLNCQNFRKRLNRFSLKIGFHQFTPTGLLMVGLRLQKGLQELVIDIPNFFIVNVGVKLRFHFATSDASHFYSLVLMIGHPQQAFS